MRKLLLLISAGSLCLLTTACTTPPPVQANRFFWPPPPKEPKVEYIQIAAGSKDLLTGKYARLAFDFTGKEELILRQPVAVTGDNQGKVYVSDAVNNAIYVFDFVNESLDLFNPGEKYALPYGLSFDSKGNLYVVERKGAKVSVFNPDQSRKFNIGEKELSEPLRIAIDEERGRIYVSDIKDHQVKVFNLDGKLIQTIGSTKGERSDIDGGFNRPNGLAVDRAGNLYVCDQLNARIQVFDPSGAFLGKWGVRGDQVDNFENPTEIEIDQSGNLWIIDIRKGALLTYTPFPEPAFISATYGADKESAGFLNFKTPKDLFITKEGRIYIPDGMLRRMSVLQSLTKEYLAQKPLPADWMQRTDILDIWYKDSGMAGPADSKEQQAQEKPVIMRVEK